ncbi:MAG: hypothetical protein ACLPVY_14860 [Acidimicrobiia bacterium]
MASQRQFEGPVLEDLLERVRAEVGPDARIVAANRIRKGGVAGFFSRQAFEVLVEADAARTAIPDSPPTPDSPTTPNSMPTPDSMPTPVRTPNPSSVPVPVRSEGRVPATILELADAVSADERNNVIDLVEERSLSTESRDFAQVLDRFSRSIDATADELGADAETASESRRAVEEIDLRTARTATTSSAGPAAPSLALPNEPVDTAPRPDEDDDLRVSTLGTVSTPRGTRPVTPSAEVIDRYETRLSKMGLPPRLIPRGVGHSGLKGALVESLIRLPPAPSVPGAVGVVIATVGVGATPVLLARDLAAEAGLDPDDVMLATQEKLGGGIPTWLQMCDAATALERRLSWRRRTRPTIVACSLPTPTRGLRWARGILDNLEPTVTWAIVDAGWKREDIAHRIEELGGVDVLALDGLDETVSPATALDIGIPVGRLEQELASPLTWTELLLERLSS